MRAENSLNLRARHKGRTLPHKVQGDGGATHPQARGHATRLRRWGTKGALLVLVAVGMAAGRSAWRHGEAAALLARFQDGGTSRLGKVGRRAVEETETTFATSQGAARARLYLPRPAGDSPGVVLVHGIHRLGIDEPRLVRFARAIAGAGLSVLTPEVRELRDYRVDPISIETIGRAAQALRAQGGRPPGVIGTSFAGGLALLAACDARFAEDIGFVVAIGAHDDLARVTRFFVTNRIERPDGTFLDLGAHAYGALVFVDSHVPQFFPPEDVATGQKALRSWLREERDAARSLAASLGEPSRTRIEDLFAGRLGAFASGILAAADDADGAMARVSPHGKLGGLRVPVFLLHGLDDSVIPATETLWLAKEVPRGLLRAVVVSGAIRHVELEGTPSLYEQWVLVDFMARVLEEAHAP